MSNKQPEALRLASTLESEQQGVDLGAEAMGWAPSSKPRLDAANELRRQHALIEEMREAAVNALDIIKTERRAFIDCNVLRDGRIDDAIAHGLCFLGEDEWLTPEDGSVVQDYDRAIAKLEAAIAKAEVRQ